MLQVYCKFEILLILIYFFIIKCVGIEQILVTINLDVASSVKVFGTFDLKLLQI